VASDNFWFPARTQLDCLDAGDFPAINGESQQGADNVPSLMTAGAGIHVQKLERGISYYLQDVVTALRS
jgi:hypothetical protein